MKWSFYEFGELVNEHKQLMEVDGEYLDRIKKNLHQSPKDLQMGRGSQRPEVQDTEGGRNLQKQVDAAKWDAAPEDAKIKGAATQALNKQYRADSAAQAQIDAPVIRKGGRVVQSLTSPADQLDDKLASDMSPEAEIAKKIHKTILENPNVFAQKQMPGPKMVNLIKQHMLKGGLESIDDKDVARGLAKLDIALDKNLLKKNDDGNFMINTLSVTGGGKGHAGVDAGAEIETGHYWQVPRKFQGIMDQIRQGQKQGMDDSQIFKLALQAKELYGDMKDQKFAGMEQGGHEDFADDWELIKHIIKKQSGIAQQPSLASLLKKKVQ